MSESICGEAKWLESHVDAGTLSPDDAEHRMVQYAEGRLTRAGAADLVSGDWRERRHYPMVEMREFTSDTEVA